MDETHFYDLYKFPKGPKSHEIELNLKNYEDYFYFKTFFTFVNGKECNNIFINLTENQKKGTIDKVLTKTFEVCEKIKLNIDGSDFFEKNMLGEQSKISGIKNKKSQITLQSGGVFWTVECDVLKITHTNSKISVLTLKAEKAVLTESDDEFFKDFYSLSNENSMCSFVLKTYFSKENIVEKMEITCTINDAENKEKKLYHKNIEKSFCQLNENLFKKEYFRKYVKNHIEHKEIFDKKLFLETLKNYGTHSGAFFNSNNNLFFNQNYQNIDIKNHLKPYNAVCGATSFLQHQFNFSGNGATNKMSNFCSLSFTNGDSRLNILDIVSDKGNNKIFQKSISEILGIETEDVVKIKCINKTNSINEKPDQTNLLFDTDDGKHITIAPINSKNFVLETYLSYNTQRTELFAEGEEYKKIIEDKDNFSKIEKNEASQKRKNVFSKIRKMENNSRFGRVYFQKNWENTTSANNSGPLTATIGGAFPIFYSMPHFEEKIPEIQPFFDMKSMSFMLNDIKIPKFVLNAQYEYFKISFEILIKEIVHKNLEKMNKLKKSKDEYKKNKINKFIDRNKNNIYFKALMKAAKIQNDCKMTQEEYKKIDNEFVEKIYEYTHYYFNEVQDLSNFKINVLRFFRNKPFTDFLCGEHYE